MHMHDLIFSIYNMFCCTTDSRPWIAVMNCSSKSSTNFMSTTPLPLDHYCFVLADGTIGLLKRAPQYLQNCTHHTVWNVRKFVAEGCSISLCRLSPAFRSCSTTAVKSYSLRAVIYCSSTFPDKSVATQLHCKNTSIWPAVTILLCKSANFLQNTVAIPIHSILLMLRSYL